MFEKNILKKLSYNKVDYYELGSYILKKFKNKYFEKKRKEVVIELLPILMSNLSKDKKLYNKNYFIVDCLSKLTDNKGFKESFIDSISNLDKSNGYRVVDSVLIVLRKLDLNEEDVKLVIDNILNIGINMDYDMDYNTISEIYNLTCDRSSKLTDYMLNTYMVNNITMDNIIKLIKNKNIDKNIIYNNIDIILSNSTNIDLFRLRDLVRENDNIYLLVKDKINSNELYVIDNLVRNLFREYLWVCKLNNKDEKSLNTIIEVIYMLMRDICRNEGVSISDLTYIGSGSFTNAFLLGDKVIKIGRDRKTKSFPNNPYINAMLLRKEFPINNRFSIYVEISEKVDTKSKISDEELYNLYKKIRDINLKWLDVDYRNVGRLIKDNKRHWNKKLPITDERLELMPYRGNEVLKKGDLVILDNDMIYDVQDDNIFNFRTCLQRRFEERYLMEKKNNGSDRRR